MAARELTESFDVTVLEAGHQFKPFDRGLGPIEHMRSTGLLRDPRMISWMFPCMRVSMTKDDMALVRGVSTGGTTTLATGNALRADESLRDMGIDLSGEFAELTAELPVSTAHQPRWRAATRGLFDACDRLGLEPKVTPKLVDYSRCDRCGRCVLGCPTGAKWDSRSLLDEAVARGATLRTGARVERVVSDSVLRPKDVTGVVYREGGRRHLLKADLVVLAAGGLETPAILRKSGVAVEDRLFVDPVLCVAAPVAGCHGDQEVPMPFYVEGDGYIISPYFDYFSFFFEPSWRHPRHDIIALMVKLADTETGSVDGKRRVTKTLTAQDKNRLAFAAECSKEVLRQTGLSRDSMFVGALNAGHPGGTLPLTGRERHPLHSDVLPDNLYVADASLLPRSLGKPPMMTIMALAKGVASQCAERFCEESPAKRIAA